MNIQQILAIINLLIAFNVPQPTVAVVQAILQNTAQPSPIEQPLNIGTFGGTAAPADTAPVEATSTVDLTINGSDGPITVIPNDCIVDGVKTCADVKVVWTTTNVDDPKCGITGLNDWAGNYGANGTKVGQVVKTTNVKISCDTANGTIGDNVVVQLKNDKQ